MSVVRLWDEKYFLFGITNALSPSNCLPNWISVFKNQKKYIILLKLPIFNLYKEKMSPVHTARFVLTQQEIKGTPLSR
ncbi:hypothetical protein T01_3528 [Trichinella spiralis]|uniref:Uncharacterized protein n=1 Tax=Trichinella spiralis TaxID=6334 RepID=A0A0V1B6H7_TRISP|nr:hypothetical protein T01_3528 [Trichinella spiralis]